MVHKWNGVFWLESGCIEKGCTRLWSASMSTQNSSARWSVRLFGTMMQYCIYVYLSLLIIIIRYKYIIYNYIYIYIYKYICMCYHQPLDVVLVSSNKNNIEAFNIQYLKRISLFDIIAISISVVISINWAGRRNESILRTCCRMVALCFALTCCWSNFVHFKWYQGRILNQLAKINVWRCQKHTTCYSASCRSPFNFTRDDSTFIWRC